MSRCLYCTLPERDKKDVLNRRDTAPNRISFVIFFLFPQIFHIIACIFSEILCGKFEAGDVWGIFYTVYIFVQS